MSGRVDLGARGRGISRDGTQSDVICGESTLHIARDTITRRARKDDLK